MNEDIEKNVAFFVDFVIDQAKVLSFRPSGNHEPIKDLTQAKVAFIEAARKIDRSSPMEPPHQERDVEDLFRSISNLQGDRYKNDDETIGVLCFAYYTVGHLIARLMRNWELSGLGRSGARKRYAQMRELEAWTLSEYRRGNWKSANQAAHALKDAVLAQSRTLEANLTESNAQRTIAEWINKDKKTV